MPIDPFAALNAMLRAEATRSAPQSVACRKQQADPQTDPAVTAEPEPERQESPTPPAR
ncbi:hypothetical protein [Streptomyces sp. NPDC006879]|uniref:hypothetical protein n=1 Tax=Streptomyces sp. NPDC006879 TaxID=3364767 RepID=UPI00367EFCCE